MAHKDAYPHLVFLHGGPGFDDYLRAHFEEPLQKRDIQATFYTQDKSLGLDGLIQELADVIERAGSKRIVLAGHSWGGTLALEAIRRKAHGKTAGLILMDAPISSRVEEAYFNELSRLGLNLPTSNEIFLSKSEIDRANGEIFLKDVLSTMDKGAFNRIDQSFLNSFDLMPFFQTITLPTLIIYGERDVRVPARYQASYREALPHAKTLVVQDGGHFPFQLSEHKEQVVSTLVEFLQGL